MMLQRSVKVAPTILLLAALVSEAAQSGSRSPAAGTPDPKGAGGTVSNPAASAPAGTPVLSFAWISDLHLDENLFDLAKAAFRLIDEELAPDFVLFTGDNCATPAPAEDPAKPEPKDLRRHRFFKAFLAAHLRAPAVVIPGDNWPGGFDRVFGPAQRSFDCCGLHVVLLAPDRTHKASGMEGLSAFDETTLAWLRKDLETSSATPAIVAIHEPVHPPTFLDAMLLRRLLADHRQVIAVLQGHLHADFNLQADGKAYITAAALGRTTPPTFKQVLVFPERLVIRTFTRDGETARFLPHGRDRYVEVPQAFRANLRRPAGEFRMENHAVVPPHPHVDDPKLLERRWELLRNLPGALDRDMRPAPEKPPAEDARPAK